MRTSIQRRIPVLLFLVALVAVPGCGSKKPVTEPQQLTPPQQMRKAQSLLKAGRTSEALATMEEAIAREPDSALLRLFQGKILFQAGKIEEAQQVLLRALELDPYLTDARNFLGAVYHEQGRLDDAEEQFMAALRDATYPSPEMIYLNLGLLYAAQGRDDDALAALRNSVTIDPKYYQGHFELASLLDRMGQLDEAASEYEVARPAYTTSGGYHYRIGLTYFKLGRAREARENLLRVQDLAPGSEDAVQADDLLKMIE